MNKLFLSIYWFVCFSLITIPAGAQQDPFNWTEPIAVEANDVFLLWLEDDGSRIHSYQKVYRFKVDSSSLPVDDLISKTLRQEDSRQGATIFTDVAHGKFNKDPYDDVVAIWVNQAGTGIDIMIPKFDTTAAMWTNSLQDSIRRQSPNNRIYVRSGNFDADSLDEFVVSNVSADDSIHLFIFDVDSTLQPSRIAHISDEKIENSFDVNYVNYFIETGDFNGDGKDEILLQSIDGSVLQSNWNIYVKIYELDGTAIVPKARRIIQSEPANFNTSAINIALSSGQFKSDTKDEIAFLTIVRDGDFINVLNWSYLYLLEASPDLQQINFDPSKRATLILGQQQQYPNHLSMAAGDLNSDGRDEVVFTTINHIYTYATDDNLNLTQKVTGNVGQGSNFDAVQSYNYLTVRDVNMDDREDIVIVKNHVSSGIADGFMIAMLSANDNLTQLPLIARLLGDESQHDDLHPYSISVGNFDGFNFKIGQPAHSVQNDVVQPIVILNSPPIHFDKFGSNIFDVNNCFNGGNCDFVATYKKQTTTSTEVSTKVSKDWAISSGVKAQGTIQGAPMGVGASVNYEAHLIGKYGKHFSKDSTNITTVSVGVEVQAREDDRIYTTVTDYDVWEYPVYHGNETFPRRTFLTVVPKSVQSAWFGSKSYNAVKYVPNHEVSNILSYQAYDTLANNPHLSQAIRASYVSDRFSLDQSSSYDWNLSFTDFQSSQADTVRDMGLDVGAELGGVFFNFEYTGKRMVTHTTSITNLIDLHVHLGSVDMGIGDVKYSVTPYAYWATNDALIVDYAAEPELAAPGFPLTWWQQMYGNNSDPAFILPWRLDPEKGFPVSEPAKRHQTKDIIFSPANPSPGDTLTVTAQVRNFSLIPTPAPVSVEFYLEDPDSGGTPIIGVNGTNTVSTIGPILERGASDVEFEWVLPSGLPAFPRIYAILDQQGAISEVHETNNKGFNVLGAPAVVTEISEEEPLKPEAYILYQAYPNPFNPVTHIEYSIPKGDKTTLRVFDILGREVTTLVDEYQTPGSYMVSFDGSNFASGVYFYRIHSGFFFETKKMILLK